MSDLNEMAQELAKIKSSKISRVEVIGKEGREYVRYFKDDEHMEWDLQDDDRTLKIFIEKDDE